MPKPKYVTTPIASEKLPKGIKYIIGNEAAERFSFYGMRAILVVFMTQYLLSSNGSGVRDVMSKEEANEYFHWFVASAYAFPILGAILADSLLGKYRTILFLSVIYCLGHLALALDETRLGLFTGLILIAIGTGAIKPCVSAHVGDQFGKMNQHLLSKVFGWFYFSINLGAFASTLLTPILLARFGPKVAFGVPGVLMFIATVIFWLGRHKFIHVPPSGFESVKEAFRGDGLRAILGLVSIYVFVAMFWSLFDQTGSAWIQQAKRMDRHWLGVDWLPSQIQAANPLLVLIFIPLFTYVIYPAIDRFFSLTPLRKVSIGFFVTVPAFAIPAWIDSQITGGEVVSATSEADMERWPVGNLFDGKIDGTGWVSAKLDGPNKTQEIVIRLRERREWDISSVSINPYSDLQEFLQNTNDDEETVSDSQVEKCWARNVEILAGETRLGDPKFDADRERTVDENEEESWEWTRSLGKLSLEHTKKFQTLEFPEVRTEYVMIRITSNWDGEYVSLGEVRINATGDLPAGTNPMAADVWPNVAATGFEPSIVWHLFAYILLTAAEIMISITCLEFSYTQAPNKLKSFIMALYLLSVSAGNVFTALVNKFIQNPDQSSKFEGANYYWFFTAVIFATAIIFVFVARSYREKRYIQGED